MGRFLITAALIALTGCSAAAASGACQQQKTCLAGHDGCGDCATENYVDVCAAQHKVELVAYSSCDDSDCAEAADALTVYLVCLAVTPCEVWQQSVDVNERITICEAESNVYRDARNACRDDKRNSCVL